MFQLFKERNFNDYINDTFQFFKILGKHFFKTYFVVNGGLLLIVTVLIYFLSKIYMDFVFSMVSAGNLEQQNSMFSYFTTNFGMIITIFILVVLFFLFVSLMQFAFPVVYLDLYDQKKGNNFTPKDILIGIRKRIPKILKFVIGFLFIMMPLFCIVFAFVIMLCLVIIGIPVLFIALPATMSFVNLTFFYYMNSEEGFFSAMGDAIDTIKGHFWPILGSTMIMFLIIQIVSTVFTLVPYFFGVASMFTTLDTGTNEDRFSVLSIMISMVFVVSTLVSYILNNLVLINQGMIYYSHIENGESSISHDSIDLIGTDSE